MYVVSKVAASCCNKFNKFTCNHGSLQLQEGTPPPSQSTATIVLNSKWQFPHIHMPPPPPGVAWETFSICLGITLAAGPQRGKCTNMYGICTWSMNPRTVCFDWYGWKVPRYRDQGRVWAPYIKENKRDYLCAGGSIYQWLLGRGALAGEYCYGVANSTPCVFIALLNRLLLAGMLLLLLLHLWLSFALLAKWSQHFPRWPRRLCCWRQSGESWRRARPWCLWSCSPWNCKRPGIGTDHNGRGLESGEG